MRGVYRRPLTHVGITEHLRVGQEIDWQYALLSIQWIMKYDVHLGGLSALDFHGFTHYLPLGGVQRIHLYGETPSWLFRLPSNTQFLVRSRVLFDNDLAGVENAWHQIESADDADARLSLNPWRWPLAVSEPERAILEALDELPAHASFDSVDMIFQSLTNLRPNRLMTLLGKCRSIKVKRLFFVFADRHAHAWLKHLDKSTFNLGSGPRALVKGGRLHPVYRIYVPGELLPRK